jgi:hypothetical protein
MLTLSNNVMVNVDFVKQCNGHHWIVALATITKDHRKSDGSPLSSSSSALETYSWFRLKSDEHGLDL